MKKINQILNNDGVIAFVTDTVWGLGCLPTSEKAVQKIYEIKNKFYEEDFDDWTIEDVLAEFPPEWNWEYSQNSSKIEI